MAKANLNAPLQTNIQKLVVMKLAKDAIPDGGGLEAGLDFLKRLGEPGFLSGRVKAAEDWVSKAIQAVKEAHREAGDRPMTDEAIAGQILAGVEAKRSKRRMS